MTEILFREIFAAVKEIPQKRCVVVLADTSRQVDAINAAAQAGLIKPVYVCNKKIGAMRDFISAKTLREVVAITGRIIADGEADLVIQGNDNRKQFLSYFMGTTGLQDQSVYSSAFYDLKKEKTFFVIDPLVAVKPTLENKINQINSLIGLLEKIFQRKIYGAALAPIETVNSKIPSTVTAAVLAQMTVRKQFGERIVIHGPLDVDCALSKKAAHRKGLDGEKSGEYDFFVLPDTNSAYFFSTFLKYIGMIPTIGVLLSGENKIMLNSGPLSDEQRGAEIALGIIASEKIKP